MAIENTFPIVLAGHSLKYEIECIAKIFLPCQSFQFLFPDADADNPLPAGEVGIFCRLTQSSDATLFYVQTTLHQNGETLLDVRTIPPCDPTNSRKEKKRCESVFGDMLFVQLQRLTGIDPPWGTLTGIRPIQKIQPLLRAGVPKAEIFQQLQEQYRVHPEKIRLAYDTAVVQEPLLRATPEKSVSLYLSIPFCPSRCSYCSFVSHAITAPSAAKRIPAYVEKLCEELIIWGDIVRRLGLRVDTVYVGGGTPTVLSSQQIEKILTAVQENFDLSSLREYCVEAGRPDTITPEKFQVMRQFGVDRVSVNPQTMQQDVLDRVGRQHTVAQTVEAFQMAREAGFQNINMDLIAGLPGDTAAGFHDTLQQVLALDPDGITVHTLTLKRAATLFPNGETQLKNPVQAMVEDSVQLLSQHGYRPYYLYRQKNTIDNLENVGYAKPGKESLYNILIMDETQTIFGAGSGASTKIVEKKSGKITRIHNHKFPYEYIDQFDSLMQKKTQIFDIFEENAALGETHE